ncbi:error-prone DNA polymerase [Caulobacter sp. S45]|uniref:error-prone DNA polymerase n=1 Tax=Caulobacter sp. S45 TaxID=1641861 RepID=UPI00131C61FE|nr:error-prone DNA polymerase [Caulobacter sp. S45]
MNDAPDYAEFAVSTCFSFLRGASHPEELLERALALGHTGMAVADRNTLAGVVRPFSRIKKLIRAYAEGSDEADPEALKRLEAFKYVVGVRLVFADGTPDVLAFPQHREAYGRLSRLLTHANTKPGVKKGDCVLVLDDLLHKSRGLSLALVPPTAGPMETCRATLERLVEANPGQVWLAAAMGYGPADARRLDALARLAENADAPLLAVNDVLYHAHERRPLQDVMTCIREHVTVAQAGRHLQPNAERHLKSRQQMARLFRDHPDAILETQRLLALCDFDLKQVRTPYPSEPTPPGKTPQQHLEALAWAGADWRYPPHLYPDGVPDKVKAMLAQEFAFIASRDYASYFLTVHDLVRFARDRGILCQGRGSAANSVVCYCLGVTSVNPEKFNLLFERFFSEARLEPPDIDVDFEHERREEVIQYVYNRYGRERAAICATVIHYRPRSAIREVGKALGLTEDVTSALAGMVWGSWGDMPPNGHIRQAGLDPTNPTILQAVDLTRQLIEFPRHLSQHVGGFILTQDRLDDTVPILNGAMPDRTFIEWDKDDIDALDISKVDVLALGMLTCIKRALNLLNRHDLSDVTDMAEIDEQAGDPPEDQNSVEPGELTRRKQEEALKVYAMVSRGDTIGVFQIESRAQMNMLPRLRPTVFYDLVIEVAIVRPGPIQGGMVHPYLKSRHLPEDQIDYPEPGEGFGKKDELKEVLKRTRGVPLFQEQVMQIAMVAAEFSGTEADGLRRAMATFRNAGGMDKYRERMTSRMIARGYPEDFAAACFKQIEGFGSYGFPESHAVSFAKLVYVSSWLKCLHPAAFACALLNSQPMGFYAPAQIVRDAREHDVEVRPADVNFSNWGCTLEPGEARDRPVLRLGLGRIDGFPEDAAKALETARGRLPRAAGDHAVFENFDALVRHARLTPSHLQTLAEADAMRSIGLDRRAALWRVRGLSRAAPAPLLTALPDTEPTVHLPRMAPSEHVVADYQTTRLSLKAHPMDFLRASFAAKAILPCAGLASMDDGSAASVAGVVLVRQRPGTGEVCFITIEDETGVANLVVLPKVFELFRKTIMSARLIEAHGRIQRAPDAKEVIHVLVHRLCDRSAGLKGLAEPQLDLGELMFGDAAPTRKPSAPRRAGVHPRNVRIMPPSRDFH